MARRGAEWAYSARGERALEVGAVVERSVGGDGDPVVVGDEHRPARARLQLPRVARHAEHRGTDVARGGAVGAALGGRVEHRPRGPAIGVCAAERKDADERAHATAPAGARRRP